MVSRVGFGAESLCEIDTDENATILIHKAYDAGINFFDISRTAKDSEKRLGNSLHGIRQHVILATKSNVSTKKEMLFEVEDSLDALQTDYIDLFQYEMNDEATFEFEQIVNAISILKERNKIKHWGISTESVDVATKLLELKNDDVIDFETIQIPFNLLTSDDSLSIVNECIKKDIGVIAMRPLYGGIVQNIPLAQGFYNQYENVVPLWGVRNIDELNQILYFNSHPPVIDDKFKEEIQKVKMFFS